MPVAIGLIEIHIITGMCMRANLKQFYTLQNSSTKNLIIIIDRPMPHISKRIIEVMEPVYEPENIIVTFLGPTYWQAWK
jgi:hypothetical protein